MSKPNRKYIVFSKDDKWELWECNGNEAKFVSSNRLLNSIGYGLCWNKDYLCSFRKKDGYEKFYSGDRKKIDEYIFPLAI